MTRPSGSRAQGGHHRQMQARRCYFRDHPDALGPRGPDGRIAHSRNNLSNFFYNSPRESTAEREVGGVEYSPLTSCVLRYPTHIYIHMPAVTDFRGLYNLHNNAIRTGTLRGESEVTAIYGVGPYLSDRISTLRGGTITTVNSFLGYIVERGNSDSSYNRLTRVLQNERAGQSIPWRNSPLPRNRGRAGRERNRGTGGMMVAADVNDLAYRSVRALICLIKDKTRIRREAAGLTIRISSDAVPKSIPARHEQSNCPGLTKSN